MGGEVGGEVGGGHKGSNGARTSGTFAPWLDINLVTLMRGVTHPGDVTSFARERERERE